MAQKFSKNQDNLFTVIFIYRINCRIVGKVVMLNLRVEFWVNGQLDISLHPVNTPVFIQTSDFLLKVEE